MIVQCAPAGKGPRRRSHILAAGLMFVAAVLWLAPTTGLAQSSGPSAAIQDFQSKLGDVVGCKTVSDRIADNGGQPVTFHSSFTFISMNAVGPPGTPAGHNTYLWSAVKDSPVIVTGEVKSRQSYPTSGRCAIYSVYNFLITDVLKNSTEATLQPGGVIQIAEPGGTLDLNEVRVHFEGDGTNLVVGRTYILFMPSYKSFRGAWSIDHWTSVQVLNERIIGLGNTSQAPFGLTMTPDQYINEIKNAVTTLK